MNERMKLKRGASKNERKSEIANERPMGFLTTQILAINHRRLNGRSLGRRPHKVKLWET